MKALICTTLLVLFTTNAYAIEPFVAVCESGDAHRYDHGNGLDIFGEKIPNPSHGWKTENWWGKDTITWDGGKELLLNYGKMAATVIGVGDHIIRAVYTDTHNLYAFTFDENLKIGILSQQQTIVKARHRRVMTRTTILKCKVESKNES